MDKLPSIVIVSSSSTKPKSIIRLITKENPEEHSNGIVIQPWKLDTKYYAATVNIIGLNDCYERDEEFNNNVEALIIHLDTNKSSGLEDLKKFESLQNECGPEIKLLISNYCNNETKITKADAISWCLQKGYEFIELYPSDPQNSGDIIPEKFGVQRVIEALQTHTWPNLIMKNTRNVGTNKLESTKQESSRLTASSLPDELISEDDFTELFSKLHMMKDSLQSVPMNQRKQYAEQMVTAFWNAIGGDEEELLDL
ncbi:alpha- and gamma-adaptin-binding protein p34-like [Sitophilus oryzae]|uniref:Alpha- and gamma-adaptin-binding protein p34-like n=1 Tax=Sitophilus oryzae TaxID=7048 RepID=A0A6J2X3K6_SITOR|nr:alpha- and gamma-adaptin-binding protein p34-like [Sitophilus oryzae]